MNQVILYGIAGASKQYVTLKYDTIYEEDISIWMIKHRASVMRMENPSIERVFAIDNRYGLRREYMESIKRHSIESCAIFKDTLEREGWEVK